MVLKNTKHNKVEWELIIALAIVKIIGNIHKNGFSWKIGMKFNGGKKKKKKNNYCLIKKNGDSYIK